MASLVFQYPCREGTTGLELEAVWYHYSRVTPVYGVGLVNAVLMALDEAAACAPEECRAAVKIQATYRMHRQAAAFRDVRRKACTIQRVFRGHATRKRIEQERLTEQRLAYLRLVFDMFATRIQACFRGYYSRKTRSNYYAQQAYILQVTTRALNVLEDAHRTRVEQDKLRLAESLRVQALSYARRTAAMHHTISTFSIPSVYVRPPAASERLAQNPPVASGEGKEDAQTETGANAPGGDELAQAALFAAAEKLEEDIRLNSRAVRHRKRGEAGRTCRGATSGEWQRLAFMEAPQQAQTAEAKDTTAASLPPSRLPAINTGSQKQEASHKGRTSRATAKGSGRRLSPAVPWQNASASAPQRPLVLRSPPAPASTSAEKAPTSTAAGGVSSFRRQFSVKRHDCVEHQLSCEAGVAKNSAAAATFPGPLSTAKESAALEHSVDQQLIKSVHGNAVFKVPAARGKRTA
jgi:hypothetical protein